MYAISFHIFILHCLTQQHACVDRDTDADADADSHVMIVTAFMIATMSMPLLLGHHITLHILASMFEIIMLATELTRW